MSAVPVMPPSFHLLYFLTFWIWSLTSCCAFPEIILKKFFRKQLHFLGWGDKPMPNLLPAGVGRSFFVWTLPLTNPARLIIPGTRGSASIAIGVEPHMPHHDDKVMNQGDEDKKVRTIGGISRNIY